MTPVSATRPVSWSPWLVFFAWFLLALTAAFSGLLPRLPRPIIPLSIFGSVAAGIAWYRSSPDLRAWVADIDLRLPIGYQLVRLFYGSLFLVMFSEGKLPASFAKIAGYGDLLAGISGLIALASSSAKARGTRPVLWVWSVIGLLDMIAVVLTAQRLFLIEKDPLMLAAFSQPLLAILPTFVVPMVFLTHGAVLTRLLRDASK